MTNPKKYKSQRRVRRNLATKKVVYEEVKTKSRAGVEYTHYKPKLVNK